MHGASVAPVPPSAHVRPWRRALAGQHVDPLQDTQHVHGDDRLRPRGDGQAPWEGKAAPALITGHASKAAGLRRSSLAREERRLCPVSGGVRLRSRAAWPAARRRWSALVLLVRSRPACSTGARVLHRRSQAPRGRSGAPVGVGGPVGGRGVESHGSARPGGAAAGARRPPSWQLDRHRLTLRKGNRSEPRPRPRRGRAR